MRSSNPILDLGQDRVRAKMAVAKNAEKQLTQAGEYVRLCEQYVDGRKLGLKPNEDLVVTIPLNDGSKIYVGQIGYHNPNIVWIAGFNQEGRQVTVLMPHTTVQIIITIVEQEEDKKRPPIGFVHSE
jgi:hypothetical protein